MICGVCVINTQLVITFLHLLARFTWCKTKEANFGHQTCPTFQEYRVHSTVPSTYVFQEEYSGRYLSVIELFFILFLHVHAEIVGVGGGGGETHTSSEERYYVPHLFCYIRGMGHSRAEYLLLTAPADKSSPL